MCVNTKIKPNIIWRRKYCEKSGEIQTIFKQTRMSKKGK